MSLISTFRSDNDSIAKKRLHYAVVSKIQQNRKSQRYRRLVYYFFEKEIQSDIEHELRSAYYDKQLLLSDPEYQALVARAALSHHVM
jgi:hypothetical protein